MKKWALTMAVVGLLVGPGLAAAYEGEGAKDPCHPGCVQNSSLPVETKSGDEPYPVVGSEHGLAKQTFASLAAKNVAAQGIVTGRAGMHLLAVRKVTVNE